MGLRQKFVLIVAMGICAFGTLFSLALLEQRQAVIDAYVARNRSVVTMAISLLQQIEQRHQAGEFSLAHAQDLAKETIGHLRYDGGEYLFVTTQAGEFLLNPQRPELEGRAVASLAMAAGADLGALLAAAVEKGEGVARYRFTRIPGGKPLDKISYARLYAPWGWMIGTGIYVEDAEAAYGKSAWRLAVVATPVGLLLIAAIFWLARSVAGPLRDLSLVVQDIESHRFRGTVPHTGRGDELGQLARAVYSLHHVSEMEDEVRRTRELIATVFDASHEAVLISDRYGTIVQASAALCRISGYGADALIGQKASILRSGHHDEAFFADLWQALLHGEGWEGDVWNRRANGEVFVVHQRISAIRDNDGTIINFVAVMHDVVEKSRRQKGQRYLPLHDPLTNLGDRTLLSEHLARVLSQAIRNGRPLALLVIDLDGFAKLNAAIGMVAGDEVLRFVALRLMKVVRSADIVARLGGDDFAVVMEEFCGIDEIRAVATRLVEAMRAPVIIDGRQVEITVSVGIALAPQDGRGESPLLKAARAALAEVKAGGGDGFAMASGVGAIRAALV
ncbi:diguanylate cyclase domain-containing protein [Magnetospirillum sulfuroxidans]|uniref:Diguanylate cyclase n=1 Tax=Magnetospirillum sulfuroxidans TaxID=611300 RepID=A0ABS5IAF6_9PROT|nr:diguanylate cyclase [Magnetospirillum sulfuroxidans]MBR9971157.1 diguanylate cyclase [Magnetospirillum sulfuroxidans]